MENHHFPSINGPFSMAMLNNQMVSPYVSIISIIFPHLSAAPRQVLPVLRCGAGQLALEVGQIVEEALDAWEGQWLIKGNGKLVLFFLVGVFFKL
jgi:hypothetical protein